MNNIIKIREFIRLVHIAIIMTTATLANAQQIKPTSSGYAPANGIKVYYEVYGEGKPILLLHGAYLTIGMNWGQLIPELAKTRKIIALELQGHGHTAYSDRKLSLQTLASDVEKVMDYLKIDSADIAGYSFGGQVAYQFAIQSSKRLKKLIIISAVKSTSELPRWMKVAGALYLNKLLPTGSYKLTEKIDNARLGVTTQEEMEMVKNYRRIADPVYMQWAISKVFNWKNQWHPQNIIHIHGDKDRVFPVRKVKPDHIIKDGTHIMIYNRAREISEVISGELASCR